MYLVATLLFDIFKTIYSIN